MIIMQHAALLLLAAPLILGLWFWRLPGRLLNWLRIALYLLVALALAEPIVMRRQDGGTVVVVADRSASMPAGSAARQEALIRGLHSHRRTHDLLGVVSFGAGAIVEHPPQQAAFGGLTTEHNPDASNLAEALQAALASIPQGTRGRVLVLSDGRYTGADPRPVAATAALRGVSIDVRPMVRGTAGDLAIVQLDAPRELRPEAALLVTAWIESPAEQRVKYQLRRGAVIVAQGARVVPRGRSSLMFRDLPSDGRGGVQGYVLSIEGELEDAIAENNNARFLVSRSGGKPLLCITAAPDSHLPRMLAAGGMEVEARRPHEFDGRLETLAGYSGVVIENTRADDIGANALGAIAAWVRHAGGGLLITGGRNSFGVGGYYQSQIEEALPISLELRREHRAYSMAIAVSLDRSGSMGMPVTGGKTKMDLANIGTAEVLQLMGDNDEIAVFAVDTVPHVIVPLMPAGKARNRAMDILRIKSMGGGIYVYEALKAALKELQGSNAGVRHVLLFADAADAEEPGNYKTLVATARAAGITISVIGLGSERDSDAALLEDIAKLGEGRIFFTEDAHEVPRLFAQDTFMVARSTWVTNAVAPQFTAARGMLSDLLPPVAPPLGGYNLCYLRPEATAIAISPDENAAPLVAVRQLGLGRTAVFTGEADGAEAGAFAQWEQVGELYGSLARYCAGASRTGAEGVLETLDSISGGARVSVHIDPERLELRGLDGLKVQALWHRPGQEPRTMQVPLTWQGVDKLSADLPLDGSDTLLASVVYPDGRVATLPPVCLPYSPEYAPDIGNSGLELLKELAETTGGHQLADVSEIWKLLPRGRRPMPLAPYLYLLAALVLLAEIFERRTGWFETLHERMRGRVQTLPQTDAPVSERSSRGRDVTSTVAKAGAVDDGDALKPETPEPASENPFDRAKRRASERTRR